MKSVALFMAGSLIACFFLFNASCKKKNTDCVARITCIDSIGTGYSSASVLLYATVKSTTGTPTTYTADLKANGTTDADGSISFKFQLPAIFDIRATSVVGTRTLVGTGIIKLEEGKTSEKTVTIK